MRNLPIEASEPQPRGAFGVERPTDEVRAHLAAIVESSADAIVGKNLDGVIQSWNRGAEHIFGYTEDEAIGMSIYKLIPPDRKDEEAFILSQIRSGHRVEPFETERIAKDGRRLHISVTVSPIRNADGVIVGASKVARDISVQKEAERLLHELNAELERRVSDRTADLEQAVRDLQSFTYSVSHDLRAPLRAIMGTSMILEEDYGHLLPPDAIDQLHRQARAARNLGELIDDLLKLSRLSRQEMAAEKLDVSAMAEELLEDSSSKAEAKIAPNLAVVGDPKLVKLALENLIQNALKFVPAGECPRLEIGKTAEGALFVRDSGIGFEPAYKEKIFGPFERLHRSDEYPGTGIGLATVKQIMDRHHGRAWAESEGAGKGATFYLSFPPARE